MRKLYLIAAALAVVALLMAGCSKSKQTYIAPGGKGTVTVEKSAGGQKTTVTTNEGKATVAGGGNLKVTEAQLGVPKYPGSEVQMSGQYEGAGKEAGKSAEQYVMSTRDSVEKVYQFYKSRIKNIETSMLQNTGQVKMGILTTKDGKTQISVNIMTDTSKNETMIQVIKAQVE